MSLPLRLGLGDRVAGRLGRPQVSSSARPLPRRPEPPRPRGSASASAAGASASAGPRPRPRRLGRRPEPRRRRLARRPAPGPRSAPSWIASPRSAPLSPRTSPVSGDASTPTNWPCSTSRAGSLAIDSICSTESALAAHRAALELRQLVLRSERRRSPWRPAATSPLHERERGRALEQRLERLGAGLVGGALGERVLDDLQRRVGLDQLAAQVGGLRDRHAAVVDREDRLAPTRCRRRPASTTAAFWSLFTLVVSNERARTQAGSEKRRMAIGCSRTPPAPDLRGRRGSRAKSSGGSGLRGRGRLLGSSSSPTMSRVRVGSTRTPGPIVVASVIVRR